ncbi:MAG: hypothetical protein AB202_00580 [Parcubacteria bacterium C7867-007]|nr:MAG: hypothetical protein AB202_00580 [Parcubacteria bacterium C7867-007]
MNRTEPHGYIGLLSLLIVAAIAGFIFLQSDIVSPKPTATPSVPNPTSPKDTTPTQRSVNSVDAARNAKQLIEASSAQQQKELDAN